MKSLRTKARKRNSSKTPRGGTQPATSVAGLDETDRAELREKVKAKANGTATESPADRYHRLALERAALEAPVLRKPRLGEPSAYSVYTGSIGELLSVSFGGLHCGGSSIAYDALQRVAGELDVLRMALKSGNVGEDGNICEEDFDMLLYTMANRCRVAAELDTRITNANKDGAS